MINFLGKNKFENSQILHRFKDGENLETLTKLYGPHKLLFTPQKIYPGACAILTNLNQNIYVVHPADTIESVSNKLKVDKQILTHKNKIKKLFVGQILSY